MKLKLPKHISPLLKCVPAVSYSVKMCIFIAVVCSSMSNHFVAQRAFVRANDKLQENRHLFMVKHEMVNIVMAKTLEKKGQRACKCGKSMFVSSFVCT